MAWMDRKERDPAAGATAHVHPMSFHTHLDKTPDADMMPDLQAILDMLVSRAIQDPRAVEKHIAESKFLSSRSPEAGVLAKIMRQMSTIVAESAAQTRETQSSGKYKGVLEAANLESDSRIDTLTRQNAALTEQLKRAVQAATDARSLTDRAMSDSDSMQELLAVQQNRVLELESALSGTMREGLVRSSLINEVTQRIGEQRKRDQTRMEEMSAQLQAQENVLYLFRQGWTMDTGGQLRPPLVQQTPAKGDGVKPGGYPFVDRDMNSSGEALANLDPLSITTKASIYESAHILDKAMNLEKTIRSAKQRYAPDYARP